MWQDLRFAFRTLWKSPGFTLVAVLALALGIGANSAIFTVVNAVVLRPLPYPHPERISVLYTSRPGGLARYGSVTDFGFLQFRKQNKTFENVAAISGGGTSLTGFGEPIPVKAQAVSAGFWPTLAVNAAIGRTFLPEEETEARSNVAVLSDSLWRSHFNADRSILGKTVKLDGKSHTIIGVMPAGFAYPAGSELWKPLVVTIRPGTQWAYRVIGRLKPGVSMEQAGAEAKTVLLGANAASEDPAKRLTAGVVSLQELTVWNIRPSLLILLGAVGFILLIACANVANLLLARGAGRRQEVAVRASLGASRGRLIRQLLTESSMLALAGGALGLLMAAWMVPLLVRLAPPGMIPRLPEVNISGQVLGFTLLLSLATSILFGMVPAIQMSKTRLMEFLKQSEGRVTSGQGFRNVLVAGEIALSLVLLIGAGLMIKSFVRLRSVNPGFNPEGVLVMTIDVPFTERSTVQEFTDYHKQALEKLATMPGVISAGAVNWLPLNRAYIMGDFYAEGKPRSVTRFNVGKPDVTPNYFRAMGMKLLRGRAFDERDTAVSPGVAIVSESVARHVWGGEDPIGKRITLEDRPVPGDWLTVVGVVDDVKQDSLDKATAPEIYQPYTQTKRPFFLAHMTYVVRANGNLSALAGQMRARFRELDRNQPIQLIAPMDDLVSATTAQPRFYSRMLGSFSALALVLASLGIYGVMAYSVAQRTREIGIRIALGAQPGEIFRSVMARSVVLVSIGVAAGLAGAFAVTRVLADLLFEVKPTDAATFAGVSAILIFVALLATFVPARRATAVDPMVALRYE